MRFGASACSARVFKESPASRGMAVKTRRTSRLIQDDAEVASDAVELPLVDFPEWAENVLQVVTFGNFTPRSTERRAIEAAARLSRDAAVGGLAVELDFEQEAPGGHGAQGDEAGVASLGITAWHAARLQPSGGLQPSDGWHPRGGMQPSGGRQPSGGLRPGGHLQPSGGTQPSGGVQPSGGLKPSSGLQTSGRMQPNNMRQPSDAAEGEVAGGEAAKCGGDDAGGEAAEGEAAGCEAAGGEAAKSGGADAGGEAAEGEATPEDGLTVNAVMPRDGLAADAATPRDGLAADAAIAGRCA